MGSEKHGESTHSRFFKVLIGDSRLHITLPPKFVSNFKGKLPETVQLRGPSRNTWRVQLKRINNRWYFEHGWPKFVQDHSLEDGDFMVFQYTGDSIFDVLMFDLTCCEKESSYFVQGHESISRSKCACQVKQNDVDYARKTLDVTNTSSVDVTDTNFDTETDVNHEKDTGKQSPRNASQSLVIQNRTYRCCFISSRRPVTEAEKCKSLMAAQAANLRNQGFVRVMKNSDVYKGFQLRIPITWAKEHLPQRSHDIHLRVSGTRKKWVVRAIHRPVGALFGSGWSTFVMDNNLEEGDACLFKHCKRGQRSKDLIVINVSIFRVVEKLVPLAKFISRP